MHVIIDIDNKKRRTRMKQAKHKENLKSNMPELVISVNSGIGENKFKCLCDYEVVLSDNHKIRILAGSVEKYIENIEYFFGDMPMQECVNLLINAVAREFPEYHISGVEYIASKY